MLRERHALPQQWESAVSSVPRELFLPDTIETGDKVISRASEPEAWLETVYDDVSITTQVNDGLPTDGDEYRLPTSSSSQPSIMLEMLTLLDVQVGDKVLELGTGTGLNAAWLAHNLGSQHVTSVEVDQALVAQASKNAEAAGYQPRIVCGDGALGWPEGASYDKVIATYAVPAISYAWVQQAPAGRIVAPWGGSFFPYSFAVLDVQDGRAVGRFTGYPAFMRNRSERPARGYLRDFLHHRDEAVETRTALSPLDLAHHAEALFYVGLALPDAWHLAVNANDDSGEVTLWILADDRSSWAAADYTPDQDTYLVTQYGPRKLWDEAEAAYRVWDQMGRPDRERAGISVTSDGQYVWLDTEEQVISGSPTHAAPMGRPLINR
ncbi:protein-L-isoaspartate(D-aspartate) O-methyltransferase [Streptomyces agglomeratus]|nr:protein-L-isoaspartate(D-aspartate) O-methyltransferase [Streptomyces agglomeratus]